VKAVEKLEILPGRDRAGIPEDFESLVLFPGDRLSVVGPTGSGKSRLLADIEWAADGDTPSGRRILWNGLAIPAMERLEGPIGRVAQISQTMGFLMDLTVVEFLRLHAQAHGIDGDGPVDETYEAAQKLTGEGFPPGARLPSLSGGQSRALMIADVAVLGAAPVVLVDEIENAGVDRKAALDLLSGKGRIVLLATHDPLLALSSPRRAVLGNGGIRSVLSRTEEEESVLQELSTLDGRVDALRKAMRSGRALE
jgi:ABC-type lipoprotein export system ATPase subunit